MPKRHFFKSNVDAFKVDKELKEASEALDKETIKQMDKCLQELTTSGNPSLDEGTMKKFKRFCRKSDDYVQYAFLLIMKQLKRNHSEIRLSAFQVADELFNRSHAFREMLVTHLQDFLALTTETEMDKPLPPPKPAANKLKTDTLHALQQWYEKYGQGYRKLAVGYDYLKNCKHVDFNDIRAQNEAERQRLENEEKRKQKIMAFRLSKVQKEISETKSEIENCAKEAESCLKLLLPTPADFLLSWPEDNETSSFQSSAQIKAEKNLGRSTMGEVLHTNTPGSSMSEQTNNDILPSNPAARPDLRDIPSNQTTPLPLSQELNKDSVENKKNEKYSEAIKVSAETKTDDLGSKTDSTDQHNSKLSSENDTNNGFLEEESIENDVGSGEEDFEEYDSDDEDNLQAHGVPNPTYSLTLELPAPGTVAVKETMDNTDVVQSLKDASKLISSSYLPRVTKWLEILGKNGAKQEDIKAAIDLKVHLENIKRKSVDLKLVSMEKEEMEKEESDDDEFEEVPEKEGFEPRIPNRLRAEYGLAGPSSHITSEPRPKLIKKSSSCGSAANAASSTLHWSLKERVKTEDPSDPTSLAAALAKVKSESSETGEQIKATTLLPSSSTASEMDTISDTREGSNVPVIEFGTDLAFWENPDKMEAPTVVKYDSLHRFWTPNEGQSEKPSNHDLASLRNRVFTFTGKFEPVKWKCRAPMPNGKLCERMDRVKCPFHGKIIARDSQGNPNGPGSSRAVKVEKEEPSEMEVKNVTELPPWQDPELQREIELVTGKDLGSARSQKLLDKGKGKGKKRKESNLTDIKAIKNTTRRRLEKRVFSKQSLKKVCATLDSADYRRVRDKFGNQFNYSLK